MTDLDLYTGLPTQPASPSLTLWADEARQAATVASSLAPTPFVPQSLRGRDDRTTAANITAAILTGQELGLTPMAALRSVVVIQGTPAMTAVALRGLVQSKGHEIWVESSSDTRAVVCGRRRGSDRVEKAVWTIDRARQLGLTGKDNWKKQPEAMLIARGTSEVGRRIAADVLLGMPYSAEELRDEGAEVEPQRTARRRAKTEPAPMPEPDLEATPDPVTSQPEPAAGDGPELITDAQSKKLHALLREAGITVRETGLAYISQIIGRDIESSKELSKAEASAAIDQIEREKEPAEEPPLDDQWPAVAEPAQ